MAWRGVIRVRVRGWLVVAGKIDQQSVTSTYQTDAVANADDPRPCTCACGYSPVKRVKVFHLLLVVNVSKNVKTVRVLYSN